VRYLALEHFVELWRFQAFPLGSGQASQRFRPALDGRHLDVEPAGPHFPHDNARQVHRAMWMLNAERDLSAAFSWFTVRRRSHVNAEPAHRLWRRGRRWLTHRARRWSRSQAIQRTGQLRGAAAGDPGVNGRRLQLDVPQECLNVTDIGVVLE
jgi:hypothetical protein